MKLKNFILSALSLLPFVLFLTIDIFFENIILSLCTSLTIILLTVLYQKLLLKKLSFFRLYDFLFYIAFFVAASLIKNNDLNLIRPAIYTTIIIVLFSVLTLSEKLTLFYIRNITGLDTIDSESTKRVQIDILLILPFLVIYVLLVIYTSLIANQLIWKLTSGISIYLFIGVPVIISEIFNRIRKKRFLLKYKDSEWFSVVDEDGKIIGRSPREVCHSGTMLLHPVVHVHVLNTERKLLLQKRSETKDIQPGKWDTSVGGHIEYGEDLIEALKREAKEELGLNIIDKYLIPLKKYIHQSEIERELVFSFIYITNDSIHFNQDEISDASFYTEQEINELVLSDKTTDNFNAEFKLLKTSELKVFQINRSQE